METSERLRKYLFSYKYKYPKVWRQFDEARALRKTSPANFWQAWCFCPVEIARKIILRQDEKSLSPSMDAGVLAGLAAWRATQGIYRFDETVFESVRRTKISGNLPVKILYRLPEWCLYIETPGKFLGDAELNGFFVYLNDDLSNRRDELRFIFDFGNDLLPFPIYLSKTTILESLQALITEQIFQGRKLELDARQYADALRELQAEIEPLISLTLYVCTQLSETSNRSLLKDNHKRKRICPPENPLIWEVGFRLGAAIRNAGTLQEKVPDLSANLRHRPRPHIRRAHWHGFWRGSKETGQEFQLKWLPPVAINTTEDREIIPTIKQFK